MSRNRRRERTTAAPAMPLILKVAVIVLVFGLGTLMVFVWRGQSLYPHELPKPAKRVVSSRAGVSVLGGRIRFHEVAAQSREYIGYYNTIRLTPEQEEVRAAALKSRPAACCMKSDAYTCCCTCNLSKTVWGLTKYAIATYHINADQVHEVVDGWLTFVNPGGFDGGTCYRGECSRPGHEKGCGGMTEDALNL